MCVLLQNNEETISHCIILLALKTWNGATQSYPLLIFFLILIWNAIWSFWVATIHDLSGLWVGSDVSYGPCFHAGYGAHRLLWGKRVWKGLSWGDVISMCVWGLNWFAIIKVHVNTNMFATTLLLYSSMQNKNRWGNIWIENLFSFFQIVTMVMHVQCFLQLLLHAIQLISPHKNKKTSK